MVTTPGGVWSLLADTKLLIQAAEIEAEEGDENLRALARHVLGMQQNEEHFPQHLAAALKALRIYSAGSALHLTGVDAVHTHEQLIREHYVVFLVGPVRHMERLEPDPKVTLRHPAPEESP